MGSSLYLFLFMHLLFSLLLCFHLLITADSLSSAQPLCHADESSALLQFKQTFSIDKSTSRDPSAYPKVSSWNLEGESGNCCSWDGVECDEDTGHVIGLDLSSSFLYGSINSSSSLFSLVHLQRLNLAHNVFNYSHIPSEIGHLSRLTSLNLSSSLFSGQIPLEISNLSKLVSLDLSYNVDSSNPRSLKLEKPGLRNLLQNLTNLNVLSLAMVSISSEVPDILANLSSLTTIVLEECELSGEFPVGIFHLPKLQFLSIRFNENLTGHLPKFHPSSPLQYLRLASTGFSGKIPDSIGNLTQLTQLDLSKNQFQSPIPRSFSELKNLETLDLSNNNFSDTELDIFLKLKNLTMLNLSGSELIVLTKNTTNTTHPKLKSLYLRSCNLKEFPDFLRFQGKLEELALHENNIHGQIPAWMTNTSKETLKFLLLMENFLTGFEQHPKFIPWVNLRILDLSNNKLKGPPPIPPTSTLFYFASNNILTGEIPTLICQFSFLYFLDFSNNKLTGTIPPCLSNFSNSLVGLRLGGNKFNGPIPQTYNKGNKLKIIDFSHNQLDGKMPRSLSNCTALEMLDLSHNLIEDTFPLWLGALTELQVLILRSNKFYGPIRSAKTMFELPKLRIIDLSHNDFTGDLPTKYFENLNAMKFFDVEHMTYIATIITSPIQIHYGVFRFFYTMNITNKGLNTMYERIQNTFIAMDLSSNKFEGEIPESIGNLKGLLLLNLSNNYLSGGIPSCLGNLTNLEALDLSQNKFSGEIPQQLSFLTFLAFLNVSNNQLTGPIPQGKQLNTFQNNSYQGNSGLCGDPLLRKCGMSEAPPPLNSEQDNDSAFPSAADWIVICMGYVSGIVVGTVIGHTLTTRYHEWFIETFGRKRHKHRKEKRRGRGK